MRLFCIGLIDLLLALAEAPVRAQPSAPPKPDADRIARLLDQLGDRDFQTREAASRGLVAEGEPALPAVRGVLRTTANLEVSTRAIAVESKILAACCKSRSVKMEFAVIPPGAFAMLNTL